MSRIGVVRSEVTARNRFRPVDWAQIQGLRSDERRICKLLAGWRPLAALATRAPATRSSDFVKREKGRKKKTMPSIRASSPAREAIFAMQDAMVVGDGRWKEAC